MDGVPVFIQVAEHHFVETRVINMWINLMLTAWYEVTLNYRICV